MPGKRHVCALMAALLVAAGGTGCMQLEACVKLHEDGSATLTERLRFSRALLDQAGDKDGELLKMLSKEAVLERMKRMGKGVSLVRHELRDTEGASKESFAEFKIEDFNELTYASPWISFIDYPENSTLKFKLEPLYKWYGFGTIAVRFYLAKTPKGIDDGKDPKVPEKGPSPQEQQIYRELGPVFRDMLKDFQLKLTFESYCPLVAVYGEKGFRNAKSKTHSVDLISFSSENQDSWGGRFLDNEEILLDLARGNLASSNITTHVQNYINNETLPIYDARRRSNWFGGVSFYVKPSRQLFDRFFKGKQIQSPWNKAPAEPADFEKIGWNGAAKKPEGKSEARQEEGGK